MKQWIINIPLSFKVHYYATTTSVLTTAFSAHARGAGITAAAGTRLALHYRQEDLYPVTQAPKNILGSLIHLTTSVTHEWVIYAPAAVLKRSSRFSGSFSGIKPQFSATRQRHFCPLYKKSADEAVAFEKS